MKWARPARITRTALIEALEGQLHVGDEVLHVLVDGAQGDGDTLDAVVSDPAGRAAVIRFAEDGEDARALTELLGQRAWLAPRLADWARLASHAKLQPDLAPRAILVAATFAPSTRAAARALGDVELVRVQGFESAGELHVALEPIREERVDPERAPRTSSPPPPSARRATGRDPVPARSEPIEAETLAPASPPPPPAPPPSVEGMFRSGLEDELLGLPRRPRNAPRSGG